MPLLEPVLEHGLTCPFILAGARVLMREQHLHAPSKVPFTLPPILCSLQRGLCNLCWQLGAQGWVCFGGALSPPALSCVCCCRIQVGRSHLERGRSAAGNIFPPAKSVLEMHHFSEGTSGGCCTPESTVGRLNFSSTNKGKVLDLAGAWRGAEAVAGFGLVPSPRSCFVLLLHLLKSSRNPCV